MKRHAYMIAVHKHPEQIRILLQLLDTEQNDLYIHIDRKSRDIEPEMLRDCVQRGRIFFVDRIAVGWAAFSIVESTLILLKSAVKNGPYAYYHLLSGQDLPLKPMEEINRFYETNDPSWNYLELIDTEEAWRKAYLRMNTRRFHRHSHETGVIRKIHAVERRICSWFWRDKRYLRAGAGWFDINHSLAEEVLAHEAWIRKSFSYASFPDEAFLQTLVMKLGLKDTCHDLMRCIDWSRKQGSPEVFHDSDFERLIRSGKNFARKFDIQEDPQIICRIKEYIERQ